MESLANTTSNAQSQISSSAQDILNQDGSGPPAQQDMSCGSEGWARAYSDKENQDLVRIYKMNPSIGLPEFRIQGQRLTGRGAKAIKVSKKLQVYSNKY